MANPVRYDDIGTVNAVKLLPKIDSYNGYIQLYTELDSHIEEGDTVFITYSGDVSNIDLDYDVILDNYIQQRNMQMFNSSKNEHIGTLALKQKLVEMANDKDCKLKYVLSGHIHSANHKFEVLKPHIDSKPIKFACTSILNEEYRTGDYEPLVIEWEK